MLCVFTQYLINDFIYHIHYDEINFTMWISYKIVPDIKAFSI